MLFRDAEIEIRPGHCQRTWQSCDYWVGERHLFHERTYARTMPSQRRVATLGELMWAGGGSLDFSEQWMPGGGTRLEMEALAVRHGGYAMEAFYAADGADEWFLAFNEPDKALAFCRTEDFDRLSPEGAVKVAA